ncbi:hypothetical protein GH5_05440 [Leishmania sp. Ghana 2012 LV757]|uniref:hypothetical protein n=1 Tax=Leishmania sp. Ghana 2012 LV757 TaxID=2803181 RepID=UPI001B72E25B|nr:hypothetical protein GH5_05440 [Leishmania sp. Ghana 2012 LV757]
MDVDAHQAVRRLYVQLLHAQHGGEGVVDEQQPDPLPPDTPAVPTTRNPLLAATYPERSSVPDTKARAPSPTSFGASVVISSAPPTPSQRPPQPAASLAATARSASKDASGLPHMTISGSGGVKGWWLGRRHGCSRSPSTTVGDTEQGDEETTSAAEVRQWKARLAHTLRQQSVKVEGQLREMLAEHVWQCLQSAAMPALTAPAPEGAPVRFSAPRVPCFLRLLSTGYAATISVQHTSGVEDEGRGLVPHSAAGNALSGAFDAEASGEDGACHDAESRRRGENACTAEAREAQRKVADIQVASLRPPASKTATAAAAPVAVASAPTAPRPKTSSLQVQLKACQTDFSQRWQSAGMPSNPLVPANTAALCSRLNACQTRAADATTTANVPAKALSTKAPLQRKANSEVPAEPPPPQCTLWEYVPISSSLRTSMSSIIETEGKPLTASPASPSTPSSSLIDKLKAAWRRCWCQPSRGAPDARRSGFESGKRAASPSEAARDPLALTTDGYWHKLQAQTRAVQDAFQLLLEAGSNSRGSRQSSGGAIMSAVEPAPSRAPAPLSACAPLSRALSPGGSEAKGSVTAVVMVCYSAAPRDLDAVQWNIRLYNGHAQAEIPPTVALQPTWALCFEVDALHEAWLRRTLLGVASRKATPFPASIAAARTLPLSSTTFSNHGTAVTSTALRMTVLASLQSMCTCG